LAFAAKHAAQHFASKVGRRRWVIRSLGPQEGIHDSTASIAAQERLAWREVAVASAAVAPLAERNAPRGLRTFHQTGMATTARSQIEKQHVSWACLVGRDSRESIADEGEEGGKASIGAKAHAARM